MTSPSVESFFVLWRLTHDQKYRDWGATVASNLLLLNGKYNKNNNSLIEGIAAVNGSLPDGTLKVDFDGRIHADYYFAETIKV